MPLNPQYMFEKQHITEPLRRVLGLPADVWYLVVNDELNSVYFLDGEFRPHSQAIDRDVRPILDIATRQRREAERNTVPLSRRRSFTDA